MQSQQDVGLKNWKQEPDRQCSIPCVFVSIVADMLLWGHMSMATTVLLGNSSAYVLAK